MYIHIYVSHLKNIGIFTHVSFTKIYKRESAYVYTYIYTHTYIYMYTYICAYIRIDVYIPLNNSKFIYFFQIVWKRVFFWLLINNYYYYIYLYMYIYIYI